jgi:hypothetical protein
MDSYHNVYPPMMMHPRYEQWIDFIFDHPVTDPPWYWDWDDELPFEATETDFAMLIRETFTNAWIDLERFSNGQVNQGLWFLASPGCSSFMYALTNEGVPLEVRLAGIRSIVALYRDFFQHRCLGTLSHLDELGSALNTICYMFWDVVPMGSLKGNRDEAALADAVFEVLAATLELPHLACKEAAIHGYGEMQYYYPERVKVVLDGFLAGEIGNAGLREYAENAKEGRIQ